MMETKELPKFFGYGRKGKWFYYNDQVGLCAFGFSSSLRLDDNRGTIEWYHHFFETGKGILLPMYFGRKLIWIEG